MGVKPKRETSRITMKAALLVLAAVVVAAYAGSSFTEESGVLCATVSGTTSLWKTGVGSSTCTVSDGVYYKGTCDNSAAIYTITAYSDSTCTTAPASGTSTPRTLTAAAVGAGTAISYN